MYARTNWLLKLSSRYEALLSWAGLHTAGMVSQPVFVIGTGRCGSTLFSSILEASAELLVFPHEGNNLWFPLTYPYRLASIDVPPIIQAPAEYTRRSTGAWPAGQARRIRTTIDGFHRLFGATKPLIYKSAMHSFMVEPILEIYPEARFIHMYRNGFSVVASLQQKEWHKYADITTVEEFERWCGTYWRDCIAEIDRVDKALSLSDSGKFFEFSYEALCADPVAIINELSRFLGVSAGSFSYDFSRIRSTNYKAAAVDSHSRLMLQSIMAPSLRLKGYFAGT